jgi:hypothetical protein
MENFFEWMSKPIEKDDVVLWFNVHNMSYEKIELFGDFFKTINHTVNSTYFNEGSPDTKILMSDEDNDGHFEWCWIKVISKFKEENILFKKEGTHKDYIKSFFMDTFYNPTEKSLKIGISDFIYDIFDIDKSFSKSDLDLLTEFYELLDKNIDS